jgi:hypothetical protein
MVDVRDDLIEVPRGAVLGRCAGEMVDIANDQSRIARGVKLDYCPTSRTCMRAMRKLPVVPIFRSLPVLIFGNLLTSSPNQKHDPRRPALI